MSGERESEEFFTDADDGRASEEGVGDTGSQAGTSSSSEESVWRWQGQPIGQHSIDEQKKQEALAACSDLHVVLVSCLRKGFFADCAEPRKAFWDCYEKHRGIRGNKIAAWFAPPSFSSGKKKQPIAQETEHTSD